MKSKTGTKTEVAEKAPKYKTVEEERKHPIIEDCEEIENGKVVRKFMLSLNGMYISGITEDQLEELFEAVTLAFQSTITDCYVGASKSRPGKKIACFFSTTR